MSRKQPFPDIVKTLIDAAKEDRCVDLTVRIPSNCVTFKGREVFIDGWPATLIDKLPPIEKRNVGEEDGGDSEASYITAHYIDAAIKEIRPSSHVEIVTPISRPLEGAYPLVITWEEIVSVKIKGPRDFYIARVTCPNCKCHFKIGMPKETTRKPIYCPNCECIV